MIEIKFPMYETIDLDKLKKIEEHKSYHHLINREKNVDFESELTGLIHYKPCRNCYFEDKLKIILEKKDIPFFDFSKDLEELELIQKAIELAIDQLREIRIHGLGTHSQGHSVAFLIHKLIQQLESHGHSFVFHNIFYDFYCNQIRSNCERLQKEFDNIFKLLTQTRFNKREKQLLLRSFFGSFEKESKHLLDWDFKYEYFALYDWCLDRMIEKVKDLNSGETMPKIIRK